jgi:hypothetical protein
MKRRIEMSEIAIGNGVSASVVLTWDLSATGSTCKKAIHHSLRKETRQFPHGRQPCRIRATQNSHDVQ